MKAVLLIGNFSGSLRPLTLSQPLPLLRFCNRSLIFHQLQALKDAGISQVVICHPNKEVPADWTAAIEQLSGELGLKLVCSQETEPAGTAGALKHAEALVTDDGTNDAPFIVVNADVLCSYPLRDLLLAHLKRGREGTLLTTRSEEPSEYGVVVVDERTGGITHFVDRPETFVSDRINCGVYVFSPAIFERIRASSRVSMNELLPAMAKAEQLNSMLLSGYWVKLTSTRSYMGAVASHLEIARYLAPASLAESTADFTVTGNVMVHPSATIGKGCVVGPAVVIGPNCRVAEGVRLESCTLLEGAAVASHAIIRESVLGLGSSIGRWCFVNGSVLGEAVEVCEALLLNGATVLPQKQLERNIRSPEIVI
ncbi:hypothetical protein EMIHUDRAFT_363030 [Emiliania huxleyi CCMP1516]|uniref:Nucleotidyl transferase domain-containing protein n=2 Tax=Emiliania huxleyi TaxID=2903 RepID=A0A0D3KHK3_EMIH1|nr:hypothetical protein EMIHUDRAFT_363030 [Emiliania huxleyi CCMP1516]EOD35238.1 hypothetical protein EMIHUDRAFT_363030 [Emiliania huxleyi CCMP1516]|eukprot:XP_005787667.1 hypothetical protein EMIHUDRAFT_363030 [Emiliania huxleyi CCMP1516]